MFGKAGSYTYAKEFPNYRAASSELIKLIKDKKFKQFLGRTDSYNKLHFTYLAGNNAAFDHDIDKETADLAFENLKETTYHIFQKLGGFNEEEQIIFEYIPKSVCTISEARTRELFDNELEPILQLVALFINPLTVAS